MNTVPDTKARLCLISLENMKSVDFAAIETVVTSMASYGHYFDKILRVSFNNAGEIVRALNEGGDFYENAVVLCPAQMLKTITDFYSAKFKASFDGLGIMCVGSLNIFVLQTDGESRLKFTDIKAVLDKKYGLRYDKAVIKTVGAPKTAIDRALSAAKSHFENGGVIFNVTDSYGDCRIEAVYSSLTPKMALDGALRDIVGKLSDYIYALEDVTIEEQLYRLLKLRRMKISVAESFTGGGVCKRLVNVSGVSEVFFEGMNTYSNRSKIQRLGVSEFTLNSHGAVSAETAYQMAEGLLKTGNCTVAVSTTGIAGPKSDNTAKPVGLAYIGVGVEDDIAVYKFNFEGDRETITQTAINRALFLAYERLK